MGIQLVVGLGNPGPDYAKTRHNAGAWLVERLAAQQGVSLRAEAKFMGLTATIELAGQVGRLLCPTTYMNRSGQAIKALAHFYKIPVESILVVHDELDLPVGVVRLKQGGGHGGHNGLRDTINHLGSPHFYRLRVGIGHPGQSHLVADYVLSKPSLAQQSLLDKAIDEALAVMPALLNGDYAKVMQQLHTKAE